jgi:hypothetical protein
MVPAPRRGVNGGPAALRLPRARVIVYGWWPAPLPVPGGTVTSPSNSKLFFFTLGLFFALPLSGCKSVVTGCEEPQSGGAALPDPSFEESPSKWTLASHSTVDDKEGVCNGTHSLRVKLDQGVGTTDVTRSAPLTGLKPGTQYEIGFHYRFENCKKAGLKIKVGTYENDLTFDGNQGEWKEASLFVTVANEPVTVDVNPQRVGTAADFSGSPYDNNLMWIDDFTLRDTTLSN